jgi:hypothetical protein
LKKGGSGTCLPLPVLLYCIPHRNISLLVDQSPASLRPATRPVVIPLFRGCLGRRVNRYAASFLTVHLHWQKTPPERFYRRPSFCACPLTPSLVRCFENLIDRNEISLVRVLVWFVERAKVNFYSSAIRERQHYDIRFGIACLLMSH